MLSPVWVGNPFMGAPNVHLAVLVCLARPRKPRNARLQALLACCTPSAALPFWPRFYM